MNVLTSLVKCIVGEGVRVPGGSRDDDEIMLDVPLYQQTDRYSCGVMAAGSVLHSMGVDVSLADLSQEIVPHEKWGTSTRKMCDALRRYDIKCRLRSHMTHRQIMACIKKGQPIITNVRERHWRHDLEHWVVIYGARAAPARVAYGVHMNWLDHWDDWAEFKYRLTRKRTFIICGG